MTLERLARESVEIAPVNGVRRGDPLAARVTLETWRDWLDAAELVTGERIEVVGGVDMAARVRSALRRYVARAAQ